MGDSLVRVPSAQARSLAVVPAGVLNFVLAGLEKVALALVALGATANGITIFSVILAAGAGCLLAFGYFGIAAAAMVISSLGDALDGLVARRTGTASIGGALLDASVDRYEEFFFLGGLAVYYRDLPLMLVLTLFALAGSFMVSYGSAKAEALSLPVPPSSMRRAERAVCLCLGAILTPPLQWFAHTRGLSEWVGRLPLLAALALISVVANLSAVRRLRALARSKPGVAGVVRESDSPRHPRGDRDDIDVDSGHAHGARVVAASHALRSP